MTTTLSTENVERIYAACLFTTEELPGEVSLETLPENAIVTEGVLNQTAFHPGRIAEHEAEILVLLSQLPVHFRADQGGGWSFLNGCMTQDGEQWTSFHRTQDMLFQLGMAIDAVFYPFPRELWSVLPGGMPYLVLRLPAAPVPDDPVDEALRFQHNANVARSAAYRPPGM